MFGLKKARALETPSYGRIQFTAHERDKIKSVDTKWKISGLLLYTNLQVSKFHFTLVLSEYANPCKSLCDRAC
jgi:hypothetical protein